MKKVFPSSLGTLVGLLLLLAVGCGGKKTEVFGAKDKQAFDKAAPELKQIWTDALEADKTNGYVEVQVLLNGLLRQPGLSAEQTQAVDNKITDVNQRMFGAAEKGDQVALKALEELRRNPPNRM